jgi:hypothetical protein
VSKIKFINLVLISALTASLLGFLYVLLGTSPVNALKILFFYIALSVLTFSTLTLLGFNVRKLVGQRELSQRYFFLAARQSLWLTLIVIISLLLSSHGLFSWINALFLIFVFIFLESYLLTKLKN